MTIRESLSAGWRKSVIWSVLSSAEVTQTSRQASAAYAPRNCNFNYKPSLEFAFNIKIGNESVATARTFRTFFIVFVQWEIQINLIQSHWLNKKFQKSLMNSLKTKKNSIGTFLIVIMEVDIVHFFSMLNETSAELLRMMVMINAGRWYSRRTGELLYKS